MANPKEVYSIYVLAYAQKEARPYSEFDKTLASSLGCIHARTEKMLMPSELAEVLRDMGAEQPDDSEARRELEHAKEQLATARGGFDAMFERDREVRAILEADDQEETIVAARRVVGLVPDMGPTARDEQERYRAAQHLKRLILADGKTDTGGRWLYDAAADEIVRLRGDLDVFRGANEIAGKRLLEHEADGLRLAADAQRAREQGAAEMRERAADALQRMKNGIKDIMARTALQDAVNAVRALPLSGATDAQVRQGAHGERAAAKLAPEVLTDEEQALLRRGGYVERDGRWQHMWAGPERDPAKPEDLAELRRDIGHLRTKHGARLLDGLSADDVDALVDAMWRRDGDIWRDPRGQAVDPRSAEGVALMRAVAKDARERKARGPRLIETPADGLSAEDAETLRDAGWHTINGLWREPTGGAVYNPRHSPGINTLRDHAARIRERAAKAPPAASGVTGEAPGGDRAAGGKGSVAEAQGEKQGAPRRDCEPVYSIGREKPVGCSMHIHEPEACSLMRSLRAPAALPKPPRVEVGQRWLHASGPVPFTVRAVSRHNDEMCATLDAKHGQIATVMESWLRESGYWTFLGPAPTPQGPSPKRDAMTRDDIANALQCDDEPADGPTARDAVAGMLLRLAWISIADDIASGAATAEGAIRRIRDAGLSSKKDGAACIAALEALARGDLCDPGEAERWEALALENKVKAERAARERDEARAEATAAKRGWDEEREYAARLKEERDAIRNEAIDLRAEAAALREERVVGEQAAPSTPLRPAEDIAREYVEARKEGDTFWFGDNKESIVLSHRFTDMSQGVDCVRRILTRYIERSRAEGKRAAVEEKKESDGSVSARAEAYVSRSREVERPSAVRLPVLPEDRGPAPAQAGVAPAGEGEAARGDEASDGRVSGRRIEKREDGEWLTGVTWNMSECEEMMTPGDTQTLCCHHVDGYHVANGDPDETGAAKILARWPIAPSQDEPQVTGALPVIVNIGTLTFAGREASDAEKAHVVAWLNAELQTLTFGEDRVHDSIHILRNADSSVRVWMPKDSDPRAVLATVAELLGLDAQEAEPMAVAPDREALGRAVHATWLAALGETGRVAPPWESRDEAARERDRRVGERLFAMGVEEGERRAAVQIPDLMRRTHDDGVVEGERRAEEKARATARCLFDSWKARRDAAESRARDCVSIARSVFDEREATLSAVLSDMRRAYAYLAPHDDKPPTGGEPAPDASEVVADRATTHVEPTAGYARRRGLAVPATGWRAEPGMRTALSPTLGQVPVAPFKPWRCECGFEADTPDCHRIMDDPSAAAPYCTLRWARNPDYVTPANDAERCPSCKGLAGHLLPCPNANREPEATDARWQPGAVWEHDGVSRPPYRYEVVRRDVDGRMRLRSEDEPTPMPISPFRMTEANGWRYVGPASEAKPGEAFDGSPADVPPEIDEQAAEVAAIVDERVSKVLTQRRDFITADLGTLIVSATAENLVPHEIASRIVRRLEVAHGFAPVVPGKPSAEERAAMQQPDIGAPDWTPEDRERARLAVDVATGKTDSAIERAHADGIVEGLRRARRLVYAFPDVAVETSFSNRLERDIEAAVERAGKPVDPMRTALDKLSAAVDEIGGVMRATVGDAPAAPVDPPHVDRAALLELATGWEREATQRRQKVRDAARVAMNQDITWSSTLASADALDRCAADLRRLLDAPRGGERIEAPPDIEPLRAALRREADAFDAGAKGLTSQSAADAMLDAAHMRRAADAIESERDAHLVLAVLGFEPMARDRVLGTSTPAAQDGSSVAQVATDEPRERNS